MTRALIIENTLKAINQLPDTKAEAIADFAHFLTKQYDEELLAAGIQKAVSAGKSFNFLNEEDELYAVADLKEIYNG